MAGEPTITILATRFWPDRYGGVEQRLWHVSRQMAWLGWRVTVLTENRIGAPAEESPEPNLTIKRFGAMNAGRLWRWSDLLRVNWWRKVLLSQPKTDYLWCSNPYMTCAALLAGRRKGLIHNPAACNSAMNALYRRDRRIQSMRADWQLRRIDRLAFAYAPQVVVSSVNLRDQLFEHYGRREEVHIIPHGSPALTPTDRSAARNRFGLNPSHWVVGFVGRLDPCKDLDFAFQAAAGGSLGDRGRLLIVGHGPDRLRLEELSRRLGIADRVIWAGEQSDTSAAYAAMDVMVLPSLYESFGLVILEAMAAGVPVIGRRRAVTREGIVLTANEELIEHGRTGFLVDPFDPRSMAARLATLRDDPHLRRSMGAEARRRATSRGWSQVVNDYLRLIERKAA